MFVTRASRRELAEVEEFYDSQSFFDAGQRPDLSEGTVFIARQGPIIGSLRVIEVAPQTIVVEDVLVHQEHRGRGVGKQLMAAAFANRGGTAYLCCHQDRVSFYEQFGFAELAQEDLPGPVHGFFDRTGALNTSERAGHVHHFMKAR